MKTDDSSKRKATAVVGAELPFPIHVPEIKRDADGKYNRPEFLNYYFEETDLVRGPEDPASFYDHFYLMVRDIENAHTALYQIFCRNAPRPAESAWTTRTFAGPLS